MFGLSESAKSTVQDDWSSLQYYDEGATCVATTSAISFGENATAIRIRPP